MQITEVEQKRELMNALFFASKFFNDAPQFKDKEVMKLWGDSLYVYYAKVIPILKALPVHFERWPSVAEILKLIDCAPKTNNDHIKEAVQSVWRYLRSIGDMTPLGGRVFDKCGGVEKLGQYKLEENFIHWNAIFTTCAKEIMRDTHDALKPKALPASEKSMTEIEKELEAQQILIHKNWYEESHYAPKLKSKMSWQEKLKIFRETGEIKEMIYTTEKDPYDMSKEDRETFKEMQRKHWDITNSPALRGIRFD